ncbi:hypothetical protein E8E14_003135 [Neopestalotiopsis sp. 37M]|nr:hypothetical protein E8E14_003135 [Neopestalotiopsis sp. 37M]
MRIFYHYSRETRRLIKRFDRQTHSFRNELHILIKSALEDDATVEDMMEDPHHAKWHCETLERSLRSLLGRNYDTCLELIEEVTITIQELEHEMRFFDGVTSNRQHDEPLKDAVRRFRSSLKITWDKSEFESSLTDLRNYNDDLRCLRQQASEMKKSKVPEQNIRKQTNAEYRNYGIIRRASSAVHYAFANSWSDVPTGLKHSVNMFIDAKIEKQVCMDVAIMCYGHDATAPPQSPPQSDSEDGPKKRQRVRFSEDCTSSKHLHSSAQVSTPDVSKPESTIAENLTGMDICLALAGDRLKLTAPSLLRYLGYMETSAVENYKHSIYHNMEKKRLKPQKLAGMSQMWERSMSSAMTVVDQLMLARNMVVAVLKFHSTPWLGQYFVADDFHFFEGEAELSSCLRTLHFSVDLVSKGCTKPEASCLQGIDTPNSSQDLTEEVKNAMMQYGIRNMTLWSLGAILLQIGRWSKINSPDDAFTVRKLSSQVPPLGPRYQELTKKCLDCDFGYGDDLSKPRLQQAVYEILVCGLAKMIESLSIHQSAG